MIVDVERGAEIVREGGVVAYPTETVYGLGADATSRAAVDAVLRLKGRGAERGLSALVTGRPELLRWVPDAPEPALRLAERFWPGPLTIVVPVRGGALEAVATRLGVGFRCSPHPTASALAKSAGRPVVSTSCNPTGEEPCRTAGEVAERFGDALPVVGGGPAEGRDASTVVAVSANGQIEVLREGPISRHALTGGTE